MDFMQKLLDKIEQRSLIPYLLIKDNEIESALTQRDQQQFSEPWMRVFEDIEKRKGGKQDADTRVSRLREIAYIQAYERWQSPDLAAYISDDFGLIGDALSINYNDIWLNGLFDSYLNLFFPKGPLMERVGQLHDNL